MLHKGLRSREGKKRGGGPHNVGTSPNSQRIEDGDDDDDAETIKAKFFTVCTYYVA